MKYFDAFSGVGTFSKVLDEAGVTNVGWSDNNKVAQRAYKQLFPSHNKLFEDFTKIDWNEVEDFDIFTGGFPCQPFSRSGKRLGFSDETKGNLFAHILRMIDNKHPRKILLENVRGLLTHDKGNTFKTVVRELSKRGYHISWSLIDSRWYSYQSRKRVYIYATKDIQQNSIFEFDEKNAELYNRIKLESCEDVIGNHCGQINDKGISYKKRYLEKQYPFKLKQILQVESEINENFDFVKLSEKQLEQQLKYKGGYTSKNGHKAAPLKFPDNINAPSRTLLRSEGVRELIVIDSELYKYRKLTSLEYVRLQGFDDSIWKELKQINLSANHIKQLMGNGVNLPTIKIILKNILEDEKS